jgi:hypothetical protein
VATFIAALSSQAAVRRLAAEVLDRYPKLDVLVNNAGALQDLLARRAVLKLMRSAAKRWRSIKAASSEHGAMGGSCLKGARSQFVFPGRKLRSLEKIRARHGRRRDEFCAINTGV